MRTRDIASLDLRGKLEPGVDETYRAQPRRAAERDDPAATALERSPHRCDTVLARTAPAKNLRVVLLVETAPRSRARLNTYSSLRTLLPPYSGAVMSSCLTSTGRAPEAVVILCAETGVGSSASGSVPSAEPSAGKALAR